MTASIKGWRVLSRILPLVVAVPFFTLQAAGEGLRDRPPHRLTILFFTASWCQPCHYVAEVLNEFSGKNKDVDVVQIDFDHARDEVRRWQVDSVPVVIVLREGRLVLRCDGADEESIKSLRTGLEEALK